MEQPLEYVASLFGDFILQDDAGGPTRGLMCRRVVEAILAHPTGVFTVGKPEARPDEIERYLDEVLDRKKADARDGTDEGNGAGAGAEALVVTDEQGDEGRRSSTGSDSGDGAGAGEGSMSEHDVGAGGGVGGNKPASPHAASPTAHAHARHAGHMGASPATVASDVAELHEEPAHVTEAVVAIRKAWVASHKQIPADVERALMHVIVCANREAAWAEELLLDKVRTWPSVLCDCQPRPHAG